MLRSRWLVSSVAIPLADAGRLDRDLLSHCTGRSLGGLRWEIPIFSVALFICCMFCHGELARSKPAPQHGLTFFYLKVALGGAAGWHFRRLWSLRTSFTTFLEFPIGVTASVFLALVFPLRIPFSPAIHAAGVGCRPRVRGEHAVSRPGVVRMRNFYGSLQIREMGDGEFGRRARYTAAAPFTGFEFASAAFRRTPTTYFGVESGAGRVLGSSRSPNRRVAIVGLGAGTLGGLRQKR